MARTLAQFTITPAEDGYQLRIEDEDGEMVELFATYEQLDLMVEEIDQHLNADEEEVLSVNGEDQSTDENP